jgi:hypothetical protein
MCQAVEVEDGIFGKRFARIVLGICVIKEGMCVRIGF